MNTVTPNDNTNNSKVSSYNTSNYPFHAVPPPPIESISTTTVQAMILPKDYIPSDYDVICGRGRGHYNQPGNKKFRVIIMSHLHEYQTLQNKIDKSIFFNKIIDIVKSQTSHDIHFIRKVSSCHNTWMMLNDEDAREKVGHAIREALSPRSCNNNTNSNNTRRSKLAISNCRDNDDDDSDCTVSSTTNATTNPTDNGDENKHAINNKLSSKSNTDADTVAPATTSLFRQSTDVIISNVMKIFDNNDCIDPIPVTSSSSEPITYTAIHNEPYHINPHMTPVVSDYAAVPSCTTTNHNDNDMWVEYQLHKKESQGLDLLLDDDNYENNIDVCNEPVPIHELNYSVSMTLAGLFNQIKNGQHQSSTSSCIRGSSLSSSSHNSIIDCFAG